MVQSCMTLFLCLCPYLYQSIRSGTVTLFLCLGPYLYQSIRSGTVTLFLCLGPYLYQSFRSGRQFNYMQMDDEASEESIPKQRPPARPPQPKSVSVPVSMATDLLIDLSDETRKKETSHSANLSNGSDASLLDSSISEKYQHLPQPISNKGSIADDPFEIRTGLMMLLPTAVSPTHSLPSRLESASSMISRTTQPNATAPSQRCNAYSNITPNEYSNISPELPPKMYANVASRESEFAKPKPSTASTNLASLPRRDLYYSAPPSVNMLNNASTVSADRYKAFECVSDAVAGFSLGKDSDGSLRDNTNGQSEKRALGSWETKKWAPIHGSTSIGQSVFYDSGADKPAPSMYSNVSTTETFADVLSDVSVTDVHSLDPLTSHQDGKHRLGPGHNHIHRARSTDAAPALPPRAPVMKTVDSAGALSNCASREHLGTARIKPVVQSGEQVSYTHYWLIPEKERRRLAQTRCASASGRIGDTEQYQNVGPSNPCLLAAVGTGHSRQKQPNNLSESLCAAGAVSDPSSMYQNVGALTVALPSVATVSMGSLKNKIDRVHQLVDGVTQEECHAALAANQWSVDAAMKYLKVEQLFRLGVTTRERCKKLLEAFQWNIEMAGSVLLDELNVGSAV